MRFIHENALWSLVDSAGLIELHYADSEVAIARIKQSGRFEGQPIFSVSPSQAIDRVPDQRNKAQVIKIRVDPHFLIPFRGQLSCRLVNPCIRNGALVEGSKQQRGCLEAM